MHLQYSINMLTQNRASCSASGLPRTALLDGFWYRMLSHNNTDMGWLWGTAWPRSWAGKENTLLVALRSSPRTGIPSASGQCSCHHRSLWPLYHWSDVKEVFPISWIALDSLCYSAETLPQHRQSVCFHAVHITASFLYPKRLPTALLLSSEGAGHADSLGDIPKHSPKHRQLPQCFSQHSDTALQLNKGSLVLLLCCLEWGEKSMPWNMTARKLGRGMRG